MAPKASRAGVTLIESVIVFGIVALLLGLLLAAVGKVRARAYRLRDENNFRQVGLAAHAYQSQHGRLPPLTGPAGMPAGYAPYTVPIAALLLDHLEQPPAATLWLPQPTGEPLCLRHVVPAYVSASDPSHDAGRAVISDDVQPGVGNVAFNVQVFGSNYAPCGPIDGNARLPGTFPDGTSNTLMLATKRGKCGPVTTRVEPGGVIYLNVGGSWWTSGDLKGHCPNGPGTPRSTTAAMIGQTLPAADGAGPTFQVAPAEADCDPDLAQGFHPGGITVGLADGSVHWVRADVAPKMWRAGLLPGDGATPLFD